MRQNTAKSRRQGTGDSRCTWPPGSTTPTIPLVSSSKGAPPLAAALSEQDPPHRITRHDFPHPTDVPVRERAGVELHLGLLRGSTRGQCKHTQMLAQEIPVDIRTLQHYSCKWCYRH